MKYNLSCLVMVLLCLVTVVPAQEMLGSFAQQPKADTPRTGVKPLSYFNAVARNKRVTLNWAIDNNKETDHFEVERSADGKTFVMIALVFGSELHGFAEYEFFEKLKKTKSWYRVKVVYKDNKTDYSAIIRPKT